jgi:branched-chain amino acid aminotransferase
VKFFSKKSDMEVSTLDVKIQKVSKSRIQEMNFNDIQFGKVYSDHMLIAYYEHGAWQNVEIVPFHNLSLSPATTFIHYGQAIFEGIKAYKDADGNPLIFRPKDNHARMNRSAVRMAMPEVPENIFIEGLQALINLDRDWVPTGEDTALYIRPFMIATDEFIGVKPAEKFMFMIITSPAGPYYSKPVSIYVQDKYVRAFPGGIGYTKAAGNYGMSMYPTMEIKKMGYDQILWTDGFEHKYVQEIGTMNVFFVLGDKVITPDINHDTILAGVTRDSVITLLRHKGITVEERPLNIDEISEAYKNGQFKEAFGTGTAASIAPIKSLTYHDVTMELPPVDTWETANWLKKELSDIRYGRTNDIHEWTLGV